MAERKPALVTPFWVRIATETNLSPGWLLIAFPAVLYPTYLALEALFGRGLAAAADLGGDIDARSMLLFAVCLGYAAMMNAYVARGTLRDLEALAVVARQQRVDESGARKPRCCQQRDGKRNGNAVDGKRVHKEQTH